MTCAIITPHDDTVIAESPSSLVGWKPLRGAASVSEMRRLPASKDSAPRLPVKGVSKSLQSACRHSIGTRQATESTVLVRANNVARAKRGDRVERGWVVTAILTEAMEVKSAQCRYPSCLSLEIGSVHSFTWAGGNHASKPANSSRKGVEGEGFEVQHLW